MSAAPRIAVVGGGPGGLFTAILARQHLPGCEVTVLERNAADATFGFGVVFSERTLGGFERADRDLHAALMDAAVNWEDIELRRGEERIRCGGHGFSAIARTTLLALMQRRARELGVRLVFEHEATEADVAGADLTVLADGVSSQWRERRAGVFAPRVEQGRSLYAWFATAQPFDALSFVFRRDEHGWWGAHAYPFAPGLSTFIVETDEATWRRAGLDQAGELAPGETDAASLRFCERLFADDLGGHGLIGNHSRWLTFPTLRCARWRDGRSALIGDAVHTAHFSVGSGTKMAMEDAVALVRAVAATGEVPAALAAYERERRPAVERIQAAAAPSLRWWESFRHVAERPLEQMAVHFLSRSPAITRERMRARDPRFVRRVETEAARRLGAAAGDGVLAAPLRVPGAGTLPSRLVVPAADVSDHRLALAAPALAGAGLVVTTPERVAADAVRWVHEHTPARVAVLAGGVDVAAGAERALDAGADVLAVELGAAAEPGWPEDRPLLALVRAPDDPDGVEADRLLAELAALAARRPALAGILAPDGDQAGLPARDFGDRLVQEAGVICVAFDVAGTHDEAETVLLAGRADLVAATPRLAAATWRPFRLPDAAVPAAPPGLLA